MKSRTSILLLALSACALTVAGQSPLAANPVSTTSPAPAPAANTTPPSTILRPPLDVLKTALSQTRIDKWRAAASTRTEAETNVASIQRDVDSTLPPLLAAADAAPASAGKLLPAYRNAEALYDVLLRVVTAGRISAPADQISGLEQALTSLDASRRALGDQLQQDADAQETRASHLEAALKAVPPPPPPSPPVVCPTPAPVVKKRKPAPKPTTPAAATQPSTTPSH